MVRLVRDGRSIVAISTSHHRGNSGGFAAKVAKKKTQRRSGDQSENDIEATKATQPDAITQAQGYWCTTSETSVHRRRSAHVRRHVNDSSRTANPL